MQPNCDSGRMLQDWSVQELQKDGSMDGRAGRTAFLTFVSGVLCLFLIGASLDSIPDPPAVVQHPQQALVVQVHDSGILPAKVVPNLANLFRQLGQCGTQREQNAEPAPSLRKLVLLPHATDTSPPSIS
jgi:hypothetical protein